MKTENLTKEQAINFLTEYAKWGIHLNYPSNPEKSLNKMEECIAVLTASGSVAAPKEEPKEESYYDLNAFIERGIKLRENQPLHYTLGSLYKTHVLPIRDQLREKDEDFKWCIRQLQEFKDNGILWFNDSDWAKLNSLIKKSQKL